MAAAFIAFAAAPLQAQGATAAISGTVLDPSGAAIAGASISVRNIGTAFTRTVLSNDQGRYVAPELPIGEYEVQGSLAGFQTVVRRGIVLTVGSRPVVDMQLPIGQAAETIGVTEEVSAAPLTPSPSALNAMTGLYQALEIAVSPAVCMLPCVRFN